MSAQHTPGPWIANLCRVYTKRSELMATAGFRRDKQEERANVLLIAAAPDLLEALRRTTEMCESYADWIKRNVMSATIEEHPYLPELEGAAEDARAAIARADGDAVGGKSGEKL